MELRELLYEEKELSAWDIDTPNTLYCALFEQILKTEGFRTRDYNTEETIARIFNDASFLCTLTINFYERPYLHIGDFRNIVTEPYSIGFSTYELEKRSKAKSYATLVLIVFYFILSHVEGNQDNPKIKRTLDETDSTLRDYSQFTNENYEAFFYAMSGVTQTIAQEDFARRTLPRALLSTINWKLITGDFNVDKIRFLIRQYGRNSIEKLAMIDAIEKCVNEEYNDTDDLPF